MVMKRAGHTTKTSATKVAPEATPLPLKVNPPAVSGDSQAKIEALRATILAQLQGQYPGVVALALGEALIASGFARSEDPGRVARQMLHRGTYPFRITRVGVKNRVLLIDLADHLAQGAGAVGSPEAGDPGE